jgi:flagellar hook-associated protein 1 FlgK
MSSSIQNIGTRALLVNQAALQTAGNNIANVNTPGYSRQSVVLKSVAGQFSGSGYYGKGVEISTVQRAYSEFLTRQATVSGSVSASDSKRLEQLKQLQDIFQGGPNGLGASVGDMLNSFSDVANAPTDLTARTVVLTRADETAARFRAASNRLADLKLGVSNDLRASVTAVNSLAKQIASVNEEIARAKGTGQTPNDLLDQRDQLIREVNKYVQTTSINADDGTVGLFLANSHPLVLGTTTSQLALVSDDFSDPSKSKLAILRNGQTTVLEESTLGGGEMAGLLRFQNNDIVETSNLLGRMALAIGGAMNEQHKLGIDLNGNAGGNLFKLGNIPVGLAATGNTGSATIAVSVQTSPTSGTTQFSASDYQVSFTSGTAGNIVRLSDGQITAFDLSVTTPVQVDGLDIQISAGSAAAGDQFLLKPFSVAASNIATLFSSPRSLAMASPVAVVAGSANTGNGSVVSLAARSNPAPAAVTLAFTAPGTYTRSDTGATTYAYTPGQAIEFDLTPPATTGWSLVMNGTPQGGDTFTVQANAYPTLNAGNAQTMLGLRDVQMFDGAVLTDGYSGLMAQVGVRVQSADFAANISKSIADNIEADRTAVSGVNLDEEAARMLQYQQSYQAAAKMLQISQSIFDTLLQGIGR